jgi:hypothetical protein
MTTCQKALTLVIMACDEVNGKLLLLLLHTFVATAPLAGHQC